MEYLFSRIIVIGACALPLGLWMEVMVGWFAAPFFGEIPINYWTMGFFHVLAWVLLLLPGSGHKEKPDGTEAPPTNSMVVEKDGHTFVLTYIK